MACISRSVSAVTKIKLMRFASPAMIFAFVTGAGTEQELFFTLKAKGSDCVAQTAIKQSHQLIKHICLRYSVFYMAIKVAFNAKRV